uniref:Uncharacterized protein n=1 Tax=Brassica oleracea TaxID=3712 RepID=A0A3P6BUU1_BRAOL|nr:unnamed protein product [Brassica oleracea]
MDPNQVQPDRIGSIDLELLRSDKSIKTREVDNFEKRSCTLRGTINSPTITTFKDTPQKGEILTFHEHETVKLDMPHDDALVIALEVGGVALSKILVDTGSVSNVISQETLRSLEQPAPKIRREANPLTSFEGSGLWKRRDSLQRYCFICSACVWDSNKWEGSGYLQVSI